MAELVLNWHLTQACNFGCKYCFAEWEDPKFVGNDREKPKPVCNDMEKVEKMLE